MSKPTILPPAVVTRGQSALFVYVFRSNHPAPRTPVDMTNGWVGTLTITDRLGGDVLLEKPITDLRADGMIVATLTGDETADLKASRHIGGRVAAAYQINLENAEFGLAEVWQGALTIAEAAQ